MELKTLFMVLVIGLMVAVPAITLAHTSEATELMSIKPTPVPDTDRTVSVTGQGKLEIKPDEATLRLRIVTQEKTPKEAQDANSRIAEQVQNALKKEGVAEEDIATVQYALHKWTEWDSHTRKQIDKGYRVTHVLKVTTQDLDNVGTLLQVAVDAGVNNIDSVTFGLSDRAEEVARERVLILASKIAQGKARVLADSFGTKLGPVKSISEANFHYTPYPYPMMEARMAYGEAASSPPIAPQDVTIQASVNAVFTLV